MKPSLQLLVTACLGTACLAVPIRGNQNITFGDCSAALGAPDLLCGTLVVPMDWENQSNGETVTLGITKIPARKPSVSIDRSTDGRLVLTCIATYRPYHLPAWRSGCPG